VQGGAANLALPISAPTLAEDRDDVVATDVLEDAHFSWIIPSVSVYGPLIKTLERNGGYRRGDFRSPPPGGDADTLYVFPYDWRRDIVESARALGEMIEGIKQKLGRPDLRFDIVAHSMGGLVARYYAMYGERDVLDDPVPCPDWAGSRNLGNVILMGAPNEGSMYALRALLRGYSILDNGKPHGGFARKIGRSVLVPRIGPREVFTVPAVYQLLPAQGNARFFDGALTPLSVDLYDVETWRYYEWSAAFDEDVRMPETHRLAQTLGPVDGNAVAMRLAAERECFLRLVLRRAAAFHCALMIESPPPPCMQFIFIGGDCLPTLDGAIILGNLKPRVIFKPSEFPGEKGSGRAVMGLLYTPGDGTVTSHSFLGHPLNAQPPGLVPVALRSTPAETRFFCSSHGGLISNRTVQNDLLMTLMSQ
jgi:pimeloyl-ACP methyl ester carboxylesterase